MTIAVDPVSDYFVVISIGDVTVIQLRDPADFHPAPPKQIDKDSLLRRLRGLPPRVDIPHWQQFGNELNSFLAVNKPGKIVLDFAGLDRMVGEGIVMSSPLLNVYVQAKRLSDSWECQWRICGLTDSVRQVYVITSLHVFFPQIHDTKTEAIAAFCPNATS